MGSDTDTTFEDDIDIDAELDTDDDVDTFDDLNDDGPKAAPKARSQIEQKLERERKAAQQREAVLMGGLKEAWAADALRDYPLADVNSIGLTGIDAAAKERFLAEVKATHEAREHALAEAGYVRLDADGKPLEPVAPAAAEVSVSGSAIEQERQAAAGWGKPLTGTDVQPNERAQAEREVLESMKGGPREVIDLLFKKNPGLSKWMTRKS